jgi:hypothetical protein
MIGARLGQAMGHIQRRNNSPMQRIAILFMLVILPLLGLGSQQKRKQKKLAYDRFLTVAISSSSGTMAVCESNYPCGFSNANVTLSAAAVNPYDDPLTFEWAVTVGKLSAMGPVMTWDLKDVALGIYTAMVRVADRHGGKGSAQVTIQVVECGICDPPPPPCPKISVSCPNRVGRGRLIVFSAP